MTLPRIPIPSIKLKSEFKIVASNVNRDIDNKGHDLSMKVVVLITNERERRTSTP